MNCLQLTKTYKPGTTGNIISALKKRLHQSGDYDEDDTTNIYSNNLLTAVKKMQATYGLKQDGIIDQSLIKQLNVPVEDRIQSNAAQPGANEMDAGGTS